MTTKINAALSVLGEMAYLMQRLTDNYARLDSMDADFKNIKQQVDAVLRMPDDDPLPEPAPVVDVAGMLATISDKMDGMEDVLGHIVAALPAPAA